MCLELIQATLALSGQTKSSFWILARLAGSGLIYASVVLFWLGTDRFGAVHPRSVWHFSLT